MRLRQNSVCVGGREREREKYTDTNRFGGWGVVREVV